MDDGVGLSVSTLRRGTLTSSWDWYVQAMRRTTSSAVFLGPSVGKDMERTPGGFETNDVVQKMKELDCKVISTRWRDSLHTGSGENGRTSQLDNLLGSRTHSRVTFFHNEVKLSSTWDHCPVYAVTQEGEEGRGFAKGRKRGMGVMAAA